MLTLISALDVIADPKKAIETVLARKASWIAILALCGVFVSVLGYEVIRGHASNAVFENPGTRMAILAALVPYPLVFAGRVALVSALLWLGCRSLNLNAKYVDVLAVLSLIQVVYVVHAGIVFALQLFVNPHIAEVGLNLVGHPAWAGPLLQIANPFSIWYFGLILLGLAAITKSNLRLAAASTGPYVGFCIGLALLRGILMHAS